MASGDPTGPAFPPRRSYCADLIRRRVAVGRTLTKDDVNWIESLLNVMEVTLDVQGAAIDELQEKYERAMADLGSLDGIAEQRRLRIQELEEELDMCDTAYRSLAEPGVR